jgi:dUTP pyrophosphatase
MERLKVRIVNRSGHGLPEYGTEMAAGMDIRASLKEPVVLKPGERKLIPTGLYIELPEGFEAQIRHRSGLAFKRGITVLNTPGTIDADYRGEIEIIIFNLSDQDFIVNDGDRICQMIVSKHERVEWIDAERVNATNRGTGGFGHTGKH